jgi:hypothetical protein
LDLFFSEKTLSNPILELLREGERERAFQTYQLYPCESLDVKMYQVIFQQLDVSLHSISM